MTRGRRGRSCLSCRASTRPGTCSGTTLSTASSNPPTTRTSWMGWSRCESMKRRGDAWGLLEATATRLVIQSWALFCKLSTESCWADAYSKCCCHPGTALTFCKLFRELTCCSTGEVPPPSWLSLTWPASAGMLSHICAAAAPHSDRRGVLDQSSTFPSSPSVERPPCAWEPVYDNRTAVLCYAARWTLPAAAC